MADFHFFTDFESITDQQDSDKFGPIDDLNYRLDTHLNLQSQSKAFAITDGLILVQENDESTLNIILKPVTQPDFNIGRVNYFIYKGIDPSSLKNGVEVADRTKNDLNEKAWFNQEKTDLNSGENPSNPSVDALGLGYKTNGIGTFNVQDTDTLDSVFFKNDDIQPIYIESGKHIGDFLGGTTKGGVEIILEKVDANAKMEVARKGNHILTITDLIGTNDYDEFLHLHKKEEILSYIDPVAFFGLFTFYTNSLMIPTSSTTEYVVNDVINLFKNKNRMYLDIRSEFGYSYNYYRNYGNVFGITSDDSLTYDLVPLKNYYSENLASTSYGIWPIFILEDEIAQDISSDSNHGSIFVKVPNENGALKGVYPQELRAEKERDGVFWFYEEDTLIEFTSWLDQASPGNKFGCSYVSLKLFFDKESGYSGFFTPGKNSVDHIFPINKLLMDLEKEPDDVAIKAYDDAAIIQKVVYPEYFGDTYSAFVGLAKDSHSYSFFSHANENIGFSQSTQLKPRINFLTSIHEGALDFFKAIHNISDHFHVGVTEFDISGDTIKVLRGIDDFDSEPIPKIIQKFFDVIQVSHTEYDQLIQLIGTSNLLSEFNVYLALDSLNSEIQEIPKFQICRTEIILEGLAFISGSGNSELEKISIPSGIFIKSLISKD